MPLPPVERIICGRVGDPRIKLDGGGATVGVCERCNSNVWMSPLSRQRQVERKLPVFCIECGVDLAKEWSDNGGVVTEIREDNQGELPGCSR